MAKGGIAPAFERFRQASDLNSKSKETQVNTLKWEKRPTASSFYSFGLSDNRKKYNAVSNKSEAHFVKRRNLSTKEKFDIRRQEEGEHVDSFSHNIALRWSIFYGTERNGTEVV